MNGATWSPWVVTHPWLALAALVLVVLVAAIAVTIERKRTGR